MPTSRQGVPRRKHKKSRYGCLECKKRHKKCDESRPDCVNCRVGGFSCSFSSNFPALPPSIHSALSTRSTSSTQEPSISSHSPVSSFNPSPHTEPPTPSLTEPTPPPDNPISQSGVFNERYNLLHLELLNHFQTQLVPSLGLGKMEHVMRLAIQEAFAAPFLMDELLALSAAHKSTLPESQNRDYYRTEATRLQTRALAEFNNETQASRWSTDNPMPVFLFSTFLGQHVLYDTLQQVASHGGDMDALIDKLGQCLSIHHGIAHVAGHSWEELIHRLPAEFASQKARHTKASDLANDPKSECYPLMQRLKRSHLDETSVRACCLAVERLQQLIDAQRPIKRSGISGPLINFVQEWPVRVPQDYITLLKERRPEALVILAHYSVLLHQARDCWVVGDAGSFLIRSISQHLGVSVDSEWEGWLQWPLKVLKDSSSAD